MTTVTVISQDLSLVVQIHMPWFSSSQPSKYIILFPLLFLPALFLIVQTVKQVYIDIPFKKFYYSLFFIILYLSCCIILYAWRVTNRRENSSFVNKCCRVVSPLLFSRSKRSDLKICYIFMYCAVGSFTNTLILFNILFLSVQLISLQSLLLWDGGPEGRNINVI